ncbi:MAG: 2,3-bisphosphoglycerate-independent phosphoglycerate mutase [Proteobacteria bacterium]|nr:2,3-bisphosphoglycerate-independent phosphoglycerate mutase [Pseudomonadota bacterium]
MSFRPAMLVILDGWGERAEVADNAVRQARTPNFDRLWAASPHAFLRTSGLDVGLPGGQMGNSEVGHLNIGAGRVVMQDLPRIGQAVADGSLARNPVLTGLIERLKATGGTCHLMGLISNGGVHSHQDHALALARIVADAGVPVVLHVFTDGRDTAPDSAAGFVRTVEAGLPKGARIGTVIGRYYAMDRDNRWERVSQAYDAMVSAKGTAFTDAAAAIAAAHASQVTDEFILPAVIGGYAGMKDGDGLLSFNFRADRVREILGALLDPGFSGFTRSKVIAFAGAVGMTQYSSDLDALMGTIFAPQNLANVIGAVVAAAGKKQLRMAETEKYPHVTYFLNGGEEAVYPGEDRIMVPSPKVATYDLQPEMSAPELTDKAVAAIDSGVYDLIVLNFANPDMVGHTGSLPAAIKAVETVDAGLGRIADAIARQGGALLFTADHGNCEMMRDPVTGGLHTAHTTNPVPVCLTAGATRLREDGRLADLAPTLLQLMGLAQPVEMDGRSLIAAEGAA